MVYEGALRWSSRSGVGQPRPSGTTHSARITGSGAHDGYVDAIRKGVNPDKSGKSRVQLHYVGEAAAEHDQIGVQEVNDYREATRQTILIDGQTLLCTFVNTTGGKRDLLRRQMSAGIVTREAPRWWGAQAGDRLFESDVPVYELAAQYSSASMMVMTRLVTAGSDGSGECAVRVGSK